MRLERYAIYDHSIRDAYEAHLLVFIELCGFSRDLEFDDLALLCKEMLRNECE